MKSTLFLLFISLFIVGLVVGQRKKNEITSTTSVGNNSKIVNESTTDPCAEIELAFKNVTEPGEMPACRCLFESLGILHESRAYDFLDGSEFNNGNLQSDGPKIWIGCTRQTMPAVFRSLNALKKQTRISEMWIWNSLINILPNDMFINVQPRTLVIESSGVSVFYKDVFSSIGKHLRSLSLKNNILKSIERKTFSDLDELRSLDLSGNKLSELRKGQFDNLLHLEKFLLSGNQIYSIEDGTFDSLSNVHTLNLQGNRLVNITKDTFRGLTNVEVLSLNGNNISSIERDAFVHMKKLRVLNLGSNKITQLELRGLANLEQLYIQNNSLIGLDRLSLQDLPKLTLLNADRNYIERINDNDFLMLAHSNENGAQLTSLSLASNNISEIGCRTFKNIPKLLALSLQSNRISTLSCPPSESILVQSVFRSLRNLRYLFLSENSIETLDDGDVNVLPNLKELALDHNRIAKIGRNTLKGINLTKLFLNKNLLYYLPEGIFDSWDTKQIKAIDLAENPRECICDQEWLDNWLSELGAANVRAGSLGCLATCGYGKNGSNTEETPVDNQEFEGHSFWITVIAIILATVALIFLVAASYIYMQSNCYPIGGAGLSLRNLPSDMIRLIPSQESLLSFPNPIATVGNVNGPELLLKPAPPPQPISSISINIGQENRAKKQYEDIDPSTNNKLDKKRVRFDGI